MTTRPSNPQWLQQVDWPLNELKAREEVRQRRRSSGEDQTAEGAKGLPGRLD